MNKLSIVPVDELEQMFRKWIKEELSLLLIVGEDNKNTEQDDQLLTTSQACLLLHISKPTLIKYKKEGKVSFISAGRSHLFSKNELLTIFKNSKRM